MLNSPGVQQPASESVLIQARGAGQSFGTDPELRQATRDVITALRGVLRAATDIRSPFTSAGLASGRSALVTFNVAGNPDNDDQAVVPALNAVAGAAARHPGLTIAEAGDASLGRATNATVSQDFRKAEVTSLPVSLAALLIVFGALIAAGIPLLPAGTAVIAAISLLAIPSHWMPIDGTTSSVVLLVGMAVGIDYSLFYLRRVREERAAGRTTADALRISAATSGRAIAVSGLTVMISLGGLFLTGIDVFSGVAIGTILVVGVAVLGSLTFLPALLSLLGKGPTAAGYRSSAAARPPPGHPGCGAPSSARWSAGRWRWAGWRRSRCWSWRRRCSRCASRTPGSTRCQRTCRWSARSARSCRRSPAAQSPPRWS
ncbi:MAG: MMPL family transporter [Trebonia sp.]